MTRYNSVLVRSLAAGIGLWLMGCGASINPALKQRVDQRVDAIQPRDDVFEAPASAQAPPLQPGTWAMYKLVDKEGQPSLYTYKVLREEHGKYWLEIISESYYERLVQLMRVGFGERRSPDDIEVDRLYRKIDDGAVEEFPSGLLGMMGSLYKPLLAHLSISWVDLPQEDARVPAGTFRQAYKKRVDTSFAGFSDTSDVWYHDAVAIGGTVRSQSLDDGTYMELIEMGTGATGEIPLPH